MYTMEKPGSPVELVHFGVKGMKWGVRRSSSSSGTAKKPMSTRKKVAIGVGVTAVVAGTAFAAYKLKQSGNDPFSAKNTTARRAGRSYLSTMTHKQWDAKIHTQRKAYEAMSDASRMQAHQNVLKALSKSADKNVDWVAIFKKNNPGILK